MDEKTTVHADQQDDVGAEASPQARPSTQEIDALGDEIAELAGQIAAAEARFLTLLGQFDEWGGWGGVGIRSLAHWLSWRAGMSLRTAREHVRMARALRQLPTTASAFAAGELSFSKVRALTRIATPATEDDLVDLAKNAPAAHVERVVAGLRKVGGAPGPAGGEQGGENASGPHEAPPQRLQWRWDEDTCELVVWGRFGAADGKVILAALTRAELERIRTLEQEPVDPGTATGGDAPDAEEPAGEGEGTGPEGDVTPPDGKMPRSEGVDRTAPPPSDAGPALVALAQLGLSAPAAPTLVQSAEVVYLHQTDAAEGSARVGSVSAQDGPGLDPGTAQEVLCGSASRCVATGARGAVLAYGRRRRLFSSSQLRALRLRDGSCQTPGCGRTRFLHAHHVVYWWEGGPTDLDNAVLLCSACHRSVHLGRLTLRALGDQRFEFVEASTEEVLAPAPPVAGTADLIMAQRTIGPRTVTGGWFGEPLDLSLVTSEMLANWRLRRTTEPPATREAPGWPTVWDDVISSGHDPGSDVWAPGPAA